MGILFVVAILCNRCYEIKIIWIKRESFIKTLTSEIISKVQARAASASVFVYPSSSAIIDTNSFFRMVSTSTFFGAACSDITFKRLVPGTANAFAILYMVADRASDRKSIMVQAGQKCCFRKQFFVENYCLTDNLIGLIMS